jgi:chromosome segregation ATPase
MTTPGWSSNLPVMPLRDQLMAQIAALLTETEGHDDLAALERTLTDGYARALALEAEHRRLEQRIRRMTRAVAEGETALRRELSQAVQLLEQQEGEIGALRQELGRLQQRHSSAVRATAN